MDASMEHYPLLCYILAQSDQTQSEPCQDLLVRYPRLAHPEVLQPMINSISDLIQVQTVLKPLSARPSQAAVNSARARCSEIENAEEVEIFRALVRVDEMYEQYEEKARDVEERLLPEVYRMSVAALGVEEEESKDVEEIMRKVVAREMVERVELQGKQLRFLPEGFGRARHLVCLNLSSNQLQVIPDTISGLQKLETLDVSCNLLESLPDSIGMLLNLKVLNVSSNQFKALPESIAGCSALEELNASYNKLRSLPINIGFGLVNLKKLLICLNQIRFLPTSLCKMSNLSHLDAHFNSLHSLPKDFGQLTALEFLDISSNFSDLTDLPDSICNLTSLRELDISNNQIRCLPDAFYELVSLTKFNPDENPLVVPPLGVAKKGAEVVRHYMAKRWQNIIAKEQLKSAAEANKLALAQAGWLGWGMSLLNGVVTEVSQGVSGYLAGDEKEPFLN